MSDVREEAIKAIRSTYVEYTMGTGGYDDFGTSSFRVRLIDKEAEAIADQLIKLGWRPPLTADTVTMSRNCAERALRDAQSKQEAWLDASTESDYGHERQQGARMAKVYEPFIAELKTALGIPVEL